MKTNKISFVSIWIMMVMAFCLNSCKERDVLHYSFSSYERSQSLIPACSQEGHIPKWLTSSIAGNPDCIDVALHLLKLDPQMKPIDFKPILEQYSYEEPKLKSRNDLREGISFSIILTMGKRLTLRGAGLVSSTTFLLRIME